MYTLPLLVLAVCAAFVYRAMNPDHHPYPKFAGRMRLGLGALVMLLCTLAGYRLPIELGAVIKSSQTTQSNLQLERQAQRLAAERDHLKQVIDLFGGIDGYRLYLQAQPPANISR